jgi:hypothetical protein
MTTSSEDHTEGCHRPQMGEAVTDPALRWAESGLAGREPTIILTCGLDLPILGLMSLDCAPWPTSQGYTWWADRAEQKRSAGRRAKSVLD